MGGPPADPAAGENGREQPRGNPHAGVDRAGIEIHVAGDTLQVHHGLLDDAGHFIPLQVAGLPAQFLGEAAQVRRPGIFRLVDAVTESGDFRPGGQLLPDVVRGQGDLPDLVEHVHHVLVGAAVQRSFERADGRRDRRVHVRERGRGDPCGEGRRVQFVVGMQDQGDVEGLRVLGVRDRTVQHVQEIGGVAQVRIRRDGIGAAGDPMPGGGNGRELGGQPDGFAQVGFAGVVRRVRVEGGQERHGRTEHVHGCRAARDGPQQVQDFLGQYPAGAELRVEFRQLARAGQVAVPQQAGGFLETGMGGEVVNVVAPVEHSALHAIDETDGRLCGYDAFKTWIDHAVSSPVDTVLCRGQNRDAAPGCQGVFGPDSAAGKVVSFGFLFVDKAPRVYLIHLRFSGDFPGRFHGATRCRHR